MAVDIENVLGKVASVTITYDSTKINKIEFLLPNDEMASNLLNICRALRKYKKL